MGGGEAGKEANSFPSFFFPCCLLPPLFRIFDADTLMHLYTVSLFHCEDLLLKSSTRFGIRSHKGECPPIIIVHFSIEFVEQIGSVDVDECVPGSQQCIWIPPVGKCTDTHWEQECSVRRRRRQPQ